MSGHGHGIHSVQSFGKGVTAVLDCPRCAGVLTLDARPGVARGARKRAVAAVSCHACRTLYTLTIELALAGGSAARRTSPETKAGG